MQWLGYLFAAAVIGAAALALWERRKSRCKADGVGFPAPPMTVRGHHTESECIRAEGVALQNPGTGGFY